ncbi:MAG: polysaccharide deacetylase family protein [Brumimicrobium sp.]
MSRDQRQENRLFRVPNMVAWFYPRRVWGFKKDKSIYLTFDDGPHPETTSWLLQILKENNIRSTFFWLGSQIEQNKGFVEKAIKDGHTIGHHGYDHISPKKQSFEDFKANFEKSKSLVPHKVYRPPYGDIKKTQAKYALQNGPLIMWNWLSYDWDKEVPVKLILRKFSTDVKGGDIIVFHENKKSKERLKQIIPEIITIVRDKGLKFASLNDKLKY